MTRHEEAVLETGIDEILQRFGIVEFEGGGAERFGVWRMELGRPHLVREGKSLADAHALIRRYQTTGIIRLIKELAQDVRAAD